MRRSVPDWIGVLVKTLRPEVGVMRIEMLGCVKGEVGLAWVGCAMWFPLLVAASCMEGL